MAIDITLLGQEYASALRSGSAAEITRMLADNPVFESPFSLWQSRQDVDAAFVARSGAVTDVSIQNVLGDADTFLVRWRGRVSQQTVEGCDVVATTSDGRITRVDVYLRPASVLERVLDAMAAAWSP